MKKHAHLSRPVSVLAALALGSTALLGFAPPAGASAGAGQFIIETGFSTGGAPGCALGTDTSDSAQASFETDAVGLAGTLSSTATAEDAGDLADDTTMTATSSGKVRATEADGSLNTLVMTTALSAGVVAAQGLTSDCDSNASAMSGAQTFFTLAQAGWVTLRGTVRGGVLEATLIDQTGDHGTVVISVGLKTEQTRQFFLPAGTYLALAIFELEVQTPSVAGDPSSAVGGGGYSLDFTPAGSASGPATGTGKKFLRMDSARSCGAGSVAGSFTSKASKVAKATFFVNGTKKKTITNPSGGTDVVLRGLADGSAAVVTVALKLTQGKATLRRVYVSCS